MKLLISKKLKLPEVFFITDKADITKVPIGVPFIFADAIMEKYLIRMLEYEVLYQSAVKSGYPFDFKQILKEAGFIDLEDFSYTYGTAPIIEFSSENWMDEARDITTDGILLAESSDAFKKYVKDASAYVDVSVLKDLNIFPVWLTKIEDAISTNIHNFAVFNSNMYNKKLEGMYGAMELVPPNRNLIIIDISGSIPKAVSSTCLSLAKNLSETFYADVLITGTISTLYEYENIHTLDVTTVYENGMNNDQAYFKKLLESEVRHYKTAIVFGDNDHPGYTWSSGDVRITDEDGKKLCKWKVEKLISLHTYDDDDQIAGYGRWFEPEEIEHIKDWVKYL